MKTTYHVFRPGVAEPETLDVDWPEDPGYDRLKRLIEPLLGGEPMERVTVLHNDARADMFVSEYGHMAIATRSGPLPRNDSATAIYRTNTMTQHPGTDPEKLPTIAGVAVLFDRIVWY